MMGKLLTILILISTINVFAETKVPCALPLNKALSKKSAAKTQTAVEKGNAEIYQFRNEMREFLWSAFTRIVDQEIPINKQELEKIVEQIEERSAALNLKVLQISQEMKLENNPALFKESSELIRSYVGMLGQLNQLHSKIAGQTGIESRTIAPPKAWDVRPQTLEEVGLMHGLIPPLRPN